MPTTSAPPPALFEEAYQDMIPRGRDGHPGTLPQRNLSATYQAAQRAAEQVAGEKDMPIEVVDSRTVSQGFGLPAEMVAREARDGASLERLKARAQNLLSRVHLYAALDTLEFLQRGGRIGGTEASPGIAAQVKPLLEVRDGEVSNWSASARVTRPSSASASSSPSSAAGGDGDRRQR